MSELVYTSRSHSKTISMLNEFLHDIEFYKREGLKEINFVVYKNTMLDYHLGYILETLNSAGYQVETSEGKQVYHLYIR